LQAAARHSAGCDHTPTFTWGRLKPHTNIQSVHMKYVARVADIFHPGVDLIKGVIILDAVPEAFRM